MDFHRFDRFVRSFSQSASRRRTLGVLVAGPLAELLGASRAEARHHRHDNTCTCGVGLTCVANGSCAVACQCNTCPTGCQCGGSYCIVQQSATCQGVLCSVDKDCPRGQVCVDCGHQFGCAPLCQP